MPATQPIPIVCLSEAFDFIAMFGEAFARQAPGLRLVAPEDVTDPGAVRYALVHDPAPDAFRLFHGLRLVCAWGAGVDNLLQHPGLPAGLPVKRMTDPGQARMMADFAAYYVTGWQRRMFGYPAQQARKEGRDINWTPPAEFPVGILGFGRMGAAIGEALRALGFPVTAWAGRARAEGGIEVLAGEAGFGRVVSDSAALINVLPLTRETEGILGAGVFARMRADAILIQLARGAHLVEPDLLAALDAGRPALAALDVFRTEPLPKESPLWTHPKVMITPHVASAADPDAVARSVAEGVRAVEAGETPAGIVDRARGY